MYIHIYKENIAENTIYLTNMLAENVNENCQRSVQLCIIINFAVRWKRIK